MTEDCSTIDAGAGNDIIRGASYIKVDAGDGDDLIYGYGDSKMFGA